MSDTVKYVLDEEEDNEYTALDAIQEVSEWDLSSEEAAKKILKALKEDSGTGPDALPVRILKKYAKELAKPVQSLTLLIIATGVWPEFWLHHWIAPLFKKRSTFDANNYRGIHLTAQLSKVVERLIKSLYLPYIFATCSFGPKQSEISRGTPS